MIVVFAILAGAVGALTRFSVDALIKRIWSTTMPWATITINITGSFILGALAGAVIFHGAPTALQTIAGTGFCGGYTTFSSASFETVRLAEQGHLKLAASNAIVSLLGSVLACAAGMMLVSL